MATIQSPGIIVAGDFQDQDSLLEEPRLKAHNPRSYDTSSITSDDVPTRPTYLGLPLSHHELSPMSNPSPSPRPWPGHPEPNCETTFVDRRNEFHSLQRFIFLSFGVPGAPVLSTFAQRCSMCFAIPFYIILFIWGTVLIAVATIEDGYIWRRRCAEILPAKIHTILAGVLYILMGLYYLLLLWWSKCTKLTKDSHYRDFSAMALCWWLLSMYFSAVTTGLSMEVYNQRHLIFIDRNVMRAEYVDCDPVTGSVDWNTEYYLYVPTNMVPMWALGSLILLIPVYSCVFLFNAITLYRTSRNLRGCCTQRVS